MHRQSITTAKHAPTSLELFTRHQAAVVPPLQSPVTHQPDGIQRASMAYIWRSYGVWLLCVAGVRAYDGGVASYVAMYGVWRPYGCYYNKTKEERTIGHGCIE